MSYNLSLKVVARWSDQLKMLTGGVVSFKSADPHATAYRLREAIAAAKRHKVEEFEDIDYAFTVTESEVIARPRENLTTEAVKVTRRVEGAVSDFEVVELASQATEHILEFPNFNGSLRSVEVWCNVNDFRMTSKPYLILRKGERDGG